MQAYNGVYCGPHVTLYEGRRSGSNGSLNTDGEASFYSGIDTETNVSHSMMMMTTMMMMMMAMMMMIIIINITKMMMMIHFTSITYFVIM